jgi:hypothetical protein
MTEIDVKNLRLNQLGVIMMTDLYGDGKGF